MTRRLLLDTHTLLWWIQDDPALDTQTRESINDPNNEIFVSAASIWEISIKRSRGRLESPRDLDAQIDRARFVRLSITFDHAELAGRLSLHHRDPFDRMLVAQAQVEDLTLVTRDRDIQRYGVQTLKA